MKNRVLVMLAAVLVLSQTANASGAETTAAETAASAVANASEMTTVEEVVEEGMVPISGDAVTDGVYEVVVESSSSMFKIDACELTAEQGVMSAKLTMSGTGYLYLYTGSGEEAAAAPETDYLPFEEDAEGKHTFTIPVEALDAPIPCAAFSKRKEKWYDRTLLVRADSLPEGVIEGYDSKTQPEELNLADGTYTVEVTLAGGSGKASVNSPAVLTVEGQECTAEIIWSSNKYDYMMVDGERYDPVSNKEYSVFVIPVDGFDYEMPVEADTTAMSQPYLIDYTLTFDSETITPAS